jgi:uncharacterized protein (TIRG00374 family)
LKHPAFKYLKYVLFFGITVLLLWWAFPSGDQRDKFWYALTHADFWWVLVSVGIALASHVSRTIRWQMLITPTGARPRFSTTFGAVMVGYLANLAFPRLGEVSKCGIINRYERIPVDKLIGTMVTERALDILTMLLLTVVILAVEFGRFGDFFSTKIAAPLGDKVVDNRLLVITAVTLAALMAVIILFTYRRLARFSFVTKTRTFVKGMWEGIKSITRVRSAWLLIFHSLFIWACYFFATWTCFFAMPATEGLGASAALAVLVFGSYGMAAPVQGGLGAFHIMAVASLAAYAIPEEEAFSFAVLIHESQLFIVIIGGAIALIVLPFLNRQRRHARSTQAQPQNPA